MEKENVYKTSLYTIFIPLENDTNEWMIVHGYTGAIDIVNNDIAQFLRKGGLINEVINESKSYPFSKNSLDKLVNRGYLTNKKPIEEKQWVSEVANLLHGRSKGGAGFCILVAYDCNFRCPYCFENGISKNGAIPWKSKTDLNFFYNTTKGNVVIMGKNTTQMHRVIRDLGVKLENNF